MRRCFSFMAVLLMLMPHESAADSHQRIRANDCAIAAGASAVENILICIEDIDAEQAQQLVDALTEFINRNAENGSSSAEFENAVLSALASIKDDLSLARAKEISDFLTREASQIGLNASRDWILGFKKTVAEKGSIISDSLALEDGGFLLHFCYPTQRYDNRTGILYHIDGFGRILNSFERFAQCPTGKLSKITGSNAYLPFSDGGRHIQVFFNIPDEINPDDNFTFPKLEGSARDEDLEFEVPFAHYFYAGSDVDDSFQQLSHFVENLNHGGSEEGSVLYFPRRPDEFFSYFDGYHHDGIAIKNELLADDASGVSVHSTGYHFRGFETPGLYLHIAGNVHRGGSLTGFVARMSESSVSARLQFAKRVFLADILAEQDGQDRTLGIDVRTVGTIFRNGKIFVLADATSTIGNLEDFYWQSMIFEFSAETLELENLVRIDNSRTKFYRDFEISDNGFYMVGVENLEIYPRPYPRHNPLAFRNARSNPILTFVSRDSSSRRDWEIEGGRAAEFTEIAPLEDGSVVLLGHAFDRELNSVDRVFLVRVTPEGLPRIDLEDVTWTDLPEFD